MLSAPIEFSVQAAAGEARAWTDLARRCEDLGVRALLAPDHPGDSPSPFVALAAAAAVTHELRLGTYVVNAGVREPIHIATDAATLDLLSAGRAEVGLGAGHTPAEWEMIGRERPSPAERVRRLIRVAAAVRHLLEGQTVPAADVGAARDLVLSELRPIQDRVPLLIGGTSAKLLQFAGGHADAVGLTGLGRTLADGHRHEVGWSTAQVDRHVGHVRAGADQAGRPAPALEALVQVLALTPDRASVLGQLAARLQCETADLEEAPYVLAGTPEQIASQLHEFRRRWGITRYVVRDHALDDLEPVLGALQR